MIATNYLKLTVRASKSLHDAEAVHTAPRDERERSFVTSWVFPFSTRAEAKLALAAAQGRRKALRAANPEIAAEAFQLSTYLPSSLRGVPVVGETVRSVADIVQAVAS